VGLTADAAARRGKVTQVLDGFSMRATKIQHAENQLLSKNALMGRIKVAKSGSNSMNSFSIRQKYFH
jgi:hypothetical protein